MQEFCEMQQTLMRNYHGELSQVFVLRFVILGEIVENLMAEHYGGHHGSQDSSPHSDNESGGHDSGGYDHSIREQDRFLPVANVSRIMKRALPANAKISKDAKETMQECVSEFISFVTGEATVNGDDLLWAMSTLGFEEYVEPLKLYLQKYRETEGEKILGTKQGEQQAGKEGGVTNGNANGGLPVSMQMMQQQAHPYARLPPNMMHDQQMMAPYQIGGGTSGVGGGGLGGQHC
ncbi:hypothetical protein O6H91_02G061000 [Diphasiastrum complanatum]|uniref:Uncharacterized protein n=1 Tax=Diphasiastrum complanatum TaxID=34168 RepID=A0ACC2EFW4_DIPCM|nr:hypothetical protein O6H91_02G061000 [Diphasiastrum complanatum]